jgi:CheY-like chemotaxis protein
MLPYKTHILIADDDPDDRECYGDSFTAVDPGYQVTLVETGTHLLNTLHSTRDRLPSLIILDNLLPDMDGERLLGILKNDNRFRSIPIIVISGHCTADRSRRLMDLGAVRCIEKPVSLAAWNSLAGQLIELAKTEGSTPGDEGPAV